jgi:hypothetical protein
MSRDFLGQRRKSISFNGLLTERQKGAVFGDCAGEQAKFPWPRAAFGL